MRKALHDIARRRQVTVDAFVTEIERRRRTSGLTATIGVHIVEFYRTAASTSGKQETTDNPKLLFVY
jgi:predicted DNA-binding ribbon-helix-helix protein